MTEQLLWQALGEQVKQFDARVESLRRRVSTAHWIVEEMDEITPAVHRLAANLSQAQDLSRKAALEGRIKAIQVFGEEADEVLRAAARLCETILALCREAIDAGRRIETWAEFEQAAGEIRQMPEGWRKKWPFIDPVMLEKTAIEYAEGRYQTAQDAFHELRSRHTPIVAS